MVTLVPTGIFIIAVDVTVPAEATMLAPLGLVIETLYVFPVQLPIL